MHNLHSKCGTVVSTVIHGTEKNGTEKNGTEVHGGDRRATLKHQPITASDLTNTMRTTISFVVLQLACIVGLTMIATAQSDGPSTPPEASVRANGSTQSSILKKLEDLVGLTDSRLEELAAKTERLMAEIVKMKSQNSDVKRVIPATMFDAKNMSNSKQLVQDEPATPAPPVPPAFADVPSITRAEIGSNESFDSVGGDLIGSDSIGDTAPVLNGSTPEWVKNGLVLGDEHSLAISSTLLPDLDQCREDLKSRLMLDVRTYLDKHVLEFSQASKLPELTQEYVEKYWVKKGQEFDNLQDRPSGTYHQLWIGLHISSEQLLKIREWEKDQRRPPSDPCRASCSRRDRLLRTALAPIRWQRRPRTQNCRQGFPGRPVQRGAGDQSWSRLLCGLADQNFLSFFATRIGVDPMSHPRQLRLRSRHTRMR